MTSEEPLQRCGIDVDTKGASGVFFAAWPLGWVGVAYCSFDDDGFDDAVARVKSQGLRLRFSIQVYTIRQQKHRVSGYETEEYTQCPNYYGVNTLKTHSLSSDPTCCEATSPCSSPRLKHFDQATQMSSQKMHATPIPVSVNHSPSSRNT